MLFPLNEVKKIFFEKTIHTKWLKVCKTFCFVKSFEIFNEKHRP